MIKLCGLILILLVLDLTLAQAVTFRELSENPQTSEEVVYAKRGDQPIVLHWFQPADLQPGEIRPVMVLIHGGGWIGGTPDAFMHLARYFATRGMVVFNITYRLAKPGMSGVGECVMDCRSALRFIRRHAKDLGADPDRIAVLGDSAGGHLAAALGTLPGFDDQKDDLGISSIPNAMILYNPIVDMTEGEWIRFAVGGVALADRKSKLPDSPEDVEVARQLSPIFHVVSGQPPALLMHGQMDKVVSVSQAERFAKAAASSGNRCDLILLPDTGHAFIVPSYKSPEPVVVSAAREADRFLASLGWLEGPPLLVPSVPPAWEPRE